MLHNYHSLNHDINLIYGLFDYSLSVLQGRGNKTMDFYSLLDHELIQSQHPANIDFSKDKC